MRRERAVARHSVEIEGGASDREQKGAVKTVKKLYCRLSPFTAIISTHTSQGNKSAVPQPGSIAIAIAIVAAL